MPTAHRIAFICPRFAEQGTVGGAETLLKALAERAVAAGRDVEFLTTCATNHFTWENSVPPGTRTIGNLKVSFFPVDDDRDVTTFLNVQGSIDKGVKISRADEEAWITHSVNSRALIAYLRENIDRFDRVIMGPYLFGIVYFASQIAPGKTFLVPCLHDEAFAYLSIMRDMFHSVAGYLYNTNPEKELARRLYDLPDGGAVVGLGLDDFTADATAFARRHNITHPYVVYSGRRETLKGTPLLTHYMHTFRERTGRDVRIWCSPAAARSRHPTRAARLPSTTVGFVSETEKRQAMAGAVCFSPSHRSTKASASYCSKSWLVPHPRPRPRQRRGVCATSAGGLGRRPLVPTLSRLRGMPAAVARR
jgi:hypothetical protein